MQESIFFVYYKVQIPLRDQVLKQINKFCREILQKYPGVSCELMQRPEMSDGGVEVWLEIYRRVKKDISQEFAQNLKEEATKQEIPLSRKMEVFAPHST